MKVSVIMPAYNSEKTILSSLESVLNQTYKDFEIIVVDDASTDRTVERVKSFSPQISQIDTDEESLHSESALEVKIIQLDKNSGPAAARNRGIQEATGEWIAFLDADDAWLPEKLEMQIGLAGEKPDVGMICGETVALKTEDGRQRTEDRSQRTEDRSQRTEDRRQRTEDRRQRTEDRRQRTRTGTEDGRQLDEENKGDNNSGKVAELELKDFAVSNPVATSTVLIKKSVLVDIGGFDEQFCGPEDYDLWMRVAKAHKVVKMDAAISRYRVDAGSLSMDDRRFLPEVLRVIDKAFSADGSMAGGNKKKAIAYQYLAASWMASNRGNSSRAFILWLRSLFEWPHSFAPEKHLPWGRVKLLYRFAINLAQKIRMAKPPMKADELDRS